MLAMMKTPPSVQTIITIFLSRSDRPLFCGSVTDGELVPVAVEPGSEVVPVPLVPVVVVPVPEETKVEEIVVPVAMSPVVVDDSEPVAVVTGAVLDSAVCPDTVDPTVV